MNYQKKFSIVKTSYRLPEIKRGRIFFDRVSASSIGKIHGFLSNRTEDDDSVYFFPGEGAYYFLFNTTNPTKFALPYNAITHEDRKELISNLEENKPKYVIYSLNTWRIDNISENIQI